MSHTRASATQQSSSYGPKQFVMLSHLANQCHYQDQDRSPITPDIMRNNEDPSFLSGYHHHNQMSLFDPLLRFYPGSSWLTLGDGRGREAFYLQEHGAKVLPTDQDDSQLQRTLAGGVFPEVARANAEELTYGDDSFDFVFCKETLHHLPRPYAALYEMMRLCRNGFAFIEPVDRKSPVSLHWHAISEQQRAIALLEHGRSPYFDEEYEEAGNYAYCFSIRDIERLALGAGLRWLAFKGIHVQDTRKLQNIIPGNRPRAHDEDPAFQEYLKNQRLLEHLSQQGLVPWGSYAFIVLTIEFPSTDLIKALEAKGWTVRRLPENPYLAENIRRAAKTSIR
ncbi:MAG: methyltransferase domain-containing protein [Bdellovibrionales bacterium]|nr:methyltransferase domain-containing protein [Bdellovibrionales bacterium]